MSQITDKRQYVENAFTNVGMVMGSDEGWNTLLDHINFYNNETQKRYNCEFSFDDMLFMYYENIYVPLTYELDTLMVKLAFRKRTMMELYLNVSEHWFSMMQEDKDTLAEDAVADYIYKASTNWFVRLFSKTAGNDLPRHTRKRAA